MSVDEAKKKEIEKEAKELLDKFSRALAGVKSEESNVERDEDRRDEGSEKCEADEEFRKIMFENAEQKNKDFIIAEKKNW